MLKTASITILMLLCAFSLESRSETLKTPFGAIQYEKETCIRYQGLIENIERVEVFEPVPKNELELWEAYGHAPSYIIMGNKVCEVVSIYNFKED